MQDVDEGHLKIKFLFQLVIKLFMLIRYKNTE